MGKWTFDYKRLQELEKRMAQLENANEKLRADNEKLRADNDKLRDDKKTKSRIEFIPNEQYEFLFGDICENGKMLKTKDRQVLNKNFNNIIRYILIALKPMIKEVNFKFVIAPPTIKDLDDYEWEIYKKVVQEMFNYLSLGKQLVSKYKEGYVYDIDTAFQHQKVETFGKTFELTSNKEERENHG